MKEEREREREIKWKKHEEDDDDDKVTKGGGVAKIDEWRLMKMKMMKGK